MSITRQPPGKGPTKPPRKRANEPKDNALLIDPKQPPGKGPSGKPKRKKPTPAK